MSFPTSGEVDSLLEWVHLEDLERRIVAARPDLRDKVAVKASRPSSVTLDLPPAPTGQERKVVVGRARNRWSMHWLVAGSVNNQLVTSAWELNTDDDVLAEAVLQTWDACAANRPPSTPWRWAEADSNQAVLVADRLVSAGLEVTGVAARNRLIPRSVEGDRQSVEVPRDFGDAIRIETRWGTATLARKPTIGWVLDVKDSLITRRVDLARSASATPSDSPGWRTEDPTLLAAATARALGELSADPPDGELFGSHLHSEDPLAEGAARWMREVGFRDVRYVEDRGSVEGPRHVALLRKRGSVGDVKTAFADAALEGRPLMMFAVEGFTRDAVKWADQARVCLFLISEDGNRVRAANHLAEEYIPRVI